jgi:hypothetical protein
VSFPYEYNCGTCILGYLNFYPIRSRYNVIISVQYYSSFLLVFQALSSLEAEESIKLYGSENVGTDTYIFQFFVSTVIDIVLREVIIIFNAYHYTLDIYTN